MCGVAMGVSIVGDDSAKAALPSGSRRTAASCSVGFGSELYCSSVAGVTKLISASASVISLGLSSTIGAIFRCAAALGCGIIVSSTSGVSARSNSFAGCSCKLGCTASLLAGVSILGIEGSGKFSAFRIGSTGWCAMVPGTSISSIGGVQVNFAAGCVRTDSWFSSAAST